jgi:hypothetical protein
LSKATPDGFRSIDVNANEGSFNSNPKNLFT